MALAASSGATARTAPGRLPDPRRSYAVLIGTAAYASAQLDDLPAVAGNLTGLAEVLTDPVLGAFPPHRCILVPDPASARIACHALRKYGALARDTLLVYWAGYGGAGPGDELYLSVTGTDVDDLPASALALGHIREAMLRSPAANRILILDSCIGGCGMPGTGVTQALTGQAAIDGGYTLVSALRGARCFSPPQGMYTAFTGALIGIMRNGMPGGQEFLTPAAVYGQLLYALASHDLPRPQQSGTGTASQLILARNPAYHRQWRWDAPLYANHRPSRPTARWRSALTAAAVVAAIVLTGFMTSISHQPARPEQIPGSTSASAVTVNQMALSIPVSFTIRVPPAAILDHATRLHAIRSIISRLNRQLAARHLRGRKVGLVQVFASGSISGIVRAQRAGLVVLGSLRRDPMFAKAAGQSFWVGDGDHFIFQIYFFT